MSETEGGFGAGVGAALRAAGRQARLWLVALMALILIGAGGAEAQLLNYDSLLQGGDAAAEEEEPAPRVFDDPDLALYGQVVSEFEEESTLEMTQRQVSVFRQKAGDVLARGPVLLSELRDLLIAASPNGDLSYWVGLSLFAVFLLSIGTAAAVVFAVYVARPVFVSLQKPNPVGMVEKLPVLAARVGITGIALVIMIAVAAAVGSGFYVEHEPTVTAVVTIFVIWGLYRLVDTCWRMIVCPYLPDYRLPSLTDRQARRLYRWLSIGAGFGIASNFGLAWLETIGLQRESIAFLTISTMLVSVLITMGMIRYNHAAISSAILGGVKRSQATWLAAAASWVWAPAIALYFIFAFIEMSYRMVLDLPARVSLLAGAFAVLLAALVVYAMTVYIIERFFMRQRLRARRMSEIAEAEDAIARDDEVVQPSERVDGDGDDGGDDGGGDGDEEGGAAVATRDRAAENAAAYRAAYTGMRTFEDLAHRIASLFALGAAVWSIIVIWAGRAAFADGSPLDQAQDIVDILFIGYIIFHAIRIWIDQKIAEEGGEEMEMEPGDEGGGASASSRLATLLPLVRGFVLFIVSAGVVMVLLMQIGVNITPILGGAGVVGIAIGFGAQALVRDILSGAFFLLDDAFRKGEYIDVGDVKGTVERISLRSFQLRHHLGALNTIPFGEIKHLTNFSRDWVMMKLPLRLTYDTDVEKVRKLIKKLGQKLLEHPTEGHKFVQPLKSQGVYMMEDSAMIIRVKFMTRPGDQWTTRKLVYSEIRELFEANDVKFAHREVTVRIPGMKDGHELTDDERSAIGAAARSAVDVAEAEAGPKPALAGADAR